MLLPINHSWSIKLVQGYSFYRYTRTEIDRATIKFIKSIVRWMRSNIDLGKFKLGLRNNWRKSGKIKRRWEILGRVWGRKVKKVLERKKRKEDIKILSKGNNKRVVQEKKVLNLIGNFKIKVF